METELIEESLDERIGRAALAGDAVAVAGLLRDKGRLDLTAAVKTISDLQKQIAQKQESREALQRELAHLQEPITAAARAYAKSLEHLEGCRIELAQIQLRQGIIDNGLEIHRDDINELTAQLHELMNSKIIGGEN